METDKRKQTIKFYVAVTVLVLILIIIAIIMIKYEVEGEQNMPFNLKSISVMSTAQTEDIKNEGDTWKANLIQKNDIYFAFEKNSNYKKQKMQHFIVKCYIFSQINKGSKQKLIK